MSFYPSMSWHKSMETHGMREARESAFSGSLQTGLIRSARFNRSSSLEVTPRVSTAGYVFGESSTNDKILADRDLFRPSCLA